MILFLEKRLSTYGKQYLTKIIKNVIEKLNNEQNNDEFILKMANELYTKCQNI